MKPGFLYAGLDDIYVTAEAMAAYETALESAPADTPAPGKAEAETDAKNSNEKPLLQQLFQEQEILRVIGELSYDPKKLPKPEPGKPGVKAEVRQELNLSVKVFDKAWERLRANLDIQTLPQSTFPQIGA